MLSQSFLWTQNAKAEHPGNEFIIGHKEFVKAVFCNMPEQLLSVIIAINESGLDAGNKKMREMQTGGKTPCGLTKYMIVVEEKLYPFKLQNKEVTLVKAKIVGVPIYTQRGLFIQNTPPVSQYFWTDVKIIENGQSEDVY